MIKKNRLHVFLLGCLLIAGCTREPDFPAQSTPDTDIALSTRATSVLSAYSDGNFEITEAEAVAMAKAAMSDTDAVPGTRSTTDPALVKNVRALTSDNFSPVINYPVKPGLVLKVKLPKILGYAVNFVDNAQQNVGFVIAPADKRIGETILATVPSGCLPISEEEEVTNDGLAFFLDNAEEYAVWRIAEAERIADSLKTAIIAEYQLLYPGEPIRVDFGNTDTSPDTRVPTRRPIITVSVVTTIHEDWHDVSRIEPLVPVEWNQRAPYNELVKNKKKCGKVVTGCVATAAAQLMAYWKYPLVVGGEPMDWDNMIKYTGTQAWIRWENKPGNRWLGPTATAPDDIQRKTAWLMKYMGESIGANYNCSTPNCPHCNGKGTTVTAGNVVDRLNNMGYHTQSGGGFNFNKAKTALQAGKPILIKGSSHKTTHRFLGIKIATTYQNGHAWLIDGYKIRQRTLKTVRTILRNGRPQRTQTAYSTETDNLIHNNWGWITDANGYFTAGVFDSNNRILKSDGTPETRGTDNYYKYDIWLWYNIYK